MLALFLAMQEQSKEVNVIEGVRRYLEEIDTKRKDRDSLKFCIRCNVPITVSNESVLECGFCHLCMVRVIRDLEFHCAALINATENIGVKEYTRTVDTLVGKHKQLCGLCGDEICECDCDKYSSDHCTYNDKFESLSVVYTCHKCWEAYTCHKCWEAYNGPKELPLHDWFNNQISGISEHETVRGCPT